jgi:isoaspartyl peptidase/L-asparaginase-like protein (Ntn-hydrolase superfamily)
VFVATWDFGELAVRAAWDHWQVHGDLAEACVAATAAVESDTTIPTVGIGGLPNRDGVVELDAGYMRGSDLACGSVAALRVTCPAIKVAQAVAERTNHVLLAGRGADDFALQEGFERFGPEAMLTEQTRGEYRAWREKVAAGEAEEDKMVGHDTVCVLGWHGGETVACVATSGLGYKRPGRVGDSPIVGGGLYADDQAGCAASTGIGEELYRHAVSVRIADAMRDGSNASAATTSVLQRMIERNPANATRGLSMIAIDRGGRVGASTTRTANHVFEMHVCRGGAFERTVPTPISV